MGKPGFAHRISGWSGFESSARVRGLRDVALEVVIADCVFERAARWAALAGEREHLGAIGQRVGVGDDEVAPCGKRDRLATQIVCRSCALRGERGSLRESRAT